MVQESISQDEARENGCHRDVYVEIGEFGSRWGDDHVIQVVITDRHLYSRRELEWAALTLSEAEELVEELEDAIAMVRKSQKCGD